MDGFDLVEGAVDTEREQASVRVGGQVDGGPRGRRRDGPHLEEAEARQVGDPEHGRGALAVRIEAIGRVARADRDADLLAEAELAGLVRGGTAGEGRQVDVEQVAVVVEHVGGAGGGGAQGGGTGRPVAREHAEGAHLERAWIQREQRPAFRHHVRGGRRAAAADGGSARGRRAGDGRDGRRRGLGRCGVGLLEPTGVGADDVAPAAAAAVVAAVVARLGDRAAGAVVVAVACDDEEGREQSAEGKSEGDDAGASHAAIELQRACQQAFAGNDAWSVHATAAPRLALAHAAGPDGAARMGRPQGAIVDCRPQEHRTAVPTGVQPDTPGPSPGRVTSPRTTAR